MCAEEWVYLRSRARTRTGKVTMISAQQAAAYYDPEKSKAAYPTRDAYLADIVDFSRREVDELVRLGCTYIQIDAPQYAALLDPKMREGYRQRGNDPDKMIDVCIEMDNAIIDGPSRHHLRHAYLPGQQPEQVLRQRRLRTDLAYLSQNAFPALPAGIRR